MKFVSMDAISFHFLHLGNGFFLDSRQCGLMTALIKAEIINHCQPLMVLLYHAVFNEYVDLMAQRDCAT